MATIRRSSTGGESTSHLLDTLRTLIGRELRIRYKGSFFGIRWALLSTLGTVVMIQCLFTRVLSISIPSFGIFEYSALLPWVWFSTAVQSGATTLSDNRYMVRTPFFSTPLLPCVVVGANFLFYLFALPVLLGMMKYGHVPLTKALVALPAIWLVQAALTLAFTFLIAAIGAIVRDVQHLMGVVILFWFYLTPIFYDMKQVPSNMQFWLSLNPMAAMVSAHRAVTLYGRFPNWASLVYVMVFSSALLGVSLLIFRALEDAFVEVA